MIYILQVFFPYLLLFYVIDCFCIVKKYHLAFSSRFGAQLRIKKPGLRFIGFYPACQLFFTANFPIFASGKGIYVWSKDTFNELDLYEEKNFDFIPFDSMEKIDCIGEKIKFNKNKSIDLGSSRLAKSVKTKIQNLQRCRDESGMVEQKGGPGSLNHFDEIRSQNAFFFGLIEVLSGMLFVLLFIILPITLYAEIPLEINFLVIEILLIYVITTCATLYTHKIICKDSTEGLLLFLHLCFAPVSSIHAVQMITKYTVFNVEWISLAAQALSPKEFKKVVSKESKRIYFSKLKCTNEDLLSFLSHKETLYRPHLEKLGLAQEDHFLPPPKRDIAAYSYCPLCETEFKNGVHECSECSVDLVVYDKTPCNFIRDP